jgi:hypothetical protein
MFAKRVISISLLIIFSLSPAFCQYSDYIGREVFLYTPERPGTIYVGVDRPSFNRMAGNLMAKNRQAYSTLKLNHEGFEVGNNTKALVLDVNFWEKTVKVKILEGTYASRVGWVLLNHAIGN